MQSDRAPTRSAGLTGGGRFLYHRGAASGEPATRVPLHVMRGSTRIAMLARVHSLTLIGVEAIPLTVECDIAGGLPGIHTVGLPDAAVRESAERVRAALRNAGHPVPPRRVTISLAPADLRKEGASLDLPIALGILAADGALPAERLEGLLILGELGLDGRLRPVRGALPAAVLARRLGLGGVVLPEGNASEAATIAGPAILPAATLDEALALVRGDRPPRPVTRAAGNDGARAAPVPDLAEVRGQAHARRALEVAAAGGHHLLMVGPPGCGKTMLARRLPGLLPALDDDEAVEVTCIYSAAGLLREGGLLRGRPFRAPHHTISGIGLIGGGRGPRPGEITLAHRGVLFLDELPEFGRATLDVLRQPIEEGEVRITRENRTVRMPARVAVVAAMNPCVCGHLGQVDRPCACTPAMVAHYRQRVSGPLLDRLDMQVAVAPVRRADLVGGRPGESTALVAGRVAAARARQTARAADGWAGQGWIGVPGEGARAAAVTNAMMTPAMIRRIAWPDEEGRRVLDRAIRILGLSARAHDGILRVARTIADLEGCEGVAAPHVAEAVQYRILDRAPLEGV